MDELDFLFNNNLEWVEVVFLCVFSLGIALFYTIIFIAFYSDKKLKPKWLFFVLLPSILLITKGVLPQYVFFSFVCIFVGCFLLFFIGVIRKGVLALIGKFKNKRKGETNISVVFDIIKTIVIIGVLGIGFFLSGPYAFILIFLYIGIQAFIKYNSKNNFLNIQANLPTSNIASMAMGLVEIKGKVKMQEPLLTRIGKKECIGYRYKIEKRHRNKDGKNSYSIISDEVTCSPFILEDATGNVLVKPEDIEFKWVQEDASYSSNGKRYTQYVLYHNDEILLIGKANSKSNLVFIEKEDARNIFTLSPFNKVTVWNRYKPLLSSFLAHMALLAVCIGIILIADIDLIENNLIFKLSWKDITFNLPWK